MELSGSRRDSLAAVEYKAIAGEGRAYYYGDLQSVEWEPFDWDRRREERFLFAIKYGTQEQIDAALEELMSRLDGLQPGTGAMRPVWPALRALCSALRSGMKRKHPGTAFSGAAFWIAIVHWRRPRRCY